MQIYDEAILNYHIQHPGGDSIPGDPNAAFYLDGVYHLHYILVLKLGKLLKLKMPTLFLTRLLENLMLSLLA